MRGIESILKLVCGFLNKNDIEYVIVGGFAVMVHGNPRATMDIDFVMNLEDKDIPKLVKFLKENNFFASEEDIKLALKEKSHFTIEDKETMFRLDIKGVYTEIDKITLKNRVKVDFEGMSIYVASPEDTIAGKLYFGRERDFEDALSVYVRRYEEIDMEYLERICERLNLVESLERLRKSYGEKK